MIELATSRLDGVLVVRSPDDEELITALLDARVPCCFAGYPGDAFADRASSVSFANEEGARSAVAHLVDRGRRVVATITGPLNNSAPRQRLDGWRHELRERDLPAGDDLVAGGDWGVASGYAAMNELIIQAVVTRKPRRNRSRNRGASEINLVSGAGVATAAERTS